MTIDFFITKGNRLPSIQDSLKDAQGAPLDLSGPAVTGVTFSMRDFATDTLQINEAAAVIVAPSTSGIVRYDWSVDDADLEAGFYRARWTVQYQGGKSLDIPNDGHITVKISSPLA